MVGIVRESVANAWMQRTSSSGANTLYVPGAKFLLGGAFGVWFGRNNLLASQGFALVATVQFERRLYYNPTKSKRKGATEVDDLSSYLIKVAPILRAMQLVACIYSASPAWKGVAEVAAGSFRLRIGLAWATLALLSLHGVLLVRATQRLDSCDRLRAWAGFSTRS